MFAVATLRALLVGRSGDTDKGLLRQTAQHRLRLWDDRQHRLQQEAAPFGVADLPQACHAGMSGQIDLRRILHQEDHRFCLQAGAGLLPMRLHQRLKGHIGFLEQSVHRFQVFPGLLLLGQRGCRIADHPTGGLDRSPGTTPIPQQRLSKGLFGPLVGMQQLRLFPSTTPFSPILAKMWVKDRSSVGG